MFFFCCFIFIAEANGAHDGWIPLTRDMYSSNSKTLSVAVNASVLRLVDSERIFDIPIHTLLAKYPSMYHEFQVKVSKQKNYLMDPKLQEWQLVVVDTGRKYKIGVKKTLGFPFEVSLGSFSQ